MPINRKLYPPEWEEMRRDALERVGYRCELCGILDTTELFNSRKPHPFYPEGTPYRVYLQLAHKSQYQTWNRAADTMVLCPSCHRKYDQQFRRKRSAKRFEPVGLVLVWVYDHGRRVLAAEVVSFAELLEVVASFEDGVPFELQPTMLMCRVGVGCYRKEPGGVAILQEEGACDLFGLFLQEVLQGVVV